MLTLPEVEAALPAHLKSNATQGLVDHLNNISNDPEAARTIRENLISYGSVLKEGKFKVEDYISAVAYVSFKLMGLSNQEAYTRTFPHRYQRLVANGASAKDISAYVAAYNKNKLVNLILEQTLIPAWVLHQDAFHKAIETQLELMLTAKSEKVRADAANSILTHLKKPEKKEVELNISATDNSGLEELKKKMLEMADMQQQLIQAGMNTREIAHQEIVDAEVIEESGP